MVKLSREQDRSECNNRILKYFDMMSDTPHHVPVTHRVYKQQVDRCTSENRENFSTVQAVSHANNAFPNLISKERHESKMG